VTDVQVYPKIWGYIDFLEAYKEIGLTADNS